MQAAAVAETASKTIAEMQISSEDLESSKEKEGEDVASTERESEDEDYKLRRSALEKLEKASDESILSQARDKMILYFFLPWCQWYYGRLLVYAMWERMWFFVYLT